MKKKPTLTAFCRTKSIHDFRSLLRDVTRLTRDGGVTNGSRVSKNLKIFVQPLDDSFYPKGNPFEVFTRDFCENEVSFFHESRFPTNFAQISASAAFAANSIVRIHRNDLFAQDEMIYLVGAEFLPEVEGQDS